MEVAFAIRPSTNSTGRQSTTWFVHGCSFCARTEWGWMAVPSRPNRYVDMSNPHSRADFGLPQRFGDQAGVDFSTRNHASESELSSLAMDG